MKNKWIEGFLHLLFPSYCLICGSRIKYNTDFICINCLADIPVTDYHLEKENELEKRFWGVFAPERATGYFYFAKGNDYENVLYHLKYKGNKEMGRKMGRMIASHLIQSGFFEGIDMLLPIPLHEKKQKQRGYNQSEWIAKGIYELTGISVFDNIISRIKNNPTQTRKRVFERWENAKDIFTLIVKEEELIGKHILIIDDVVTTGATISECASVIKDIPGIKLSILTLAVVRN